MKNELKLISMDTVETENVQWLWYPYIPLGKITIVQGDPGEGKTTFALAVIAALTRGEPLPECEEAMEPMNVIYQTAEDGLADTIKPRLVAAGADCTRVLVIDETNKELTLIDERLEAAIKETGARLIVLDPIQAYLGEEVDMHRANEVRPVLKRVAAMAERTHCAVLLVGHMNNAQGQKSSYRGLGSIDFRAAARSVLVVGRLKDNERIRIVAQDKNSLAPEGSSIAFELNEQTGFCWKGGCEATVDDVLNGTGKVQTKTMLMEEELKEAQREITVLQKKVDSMTKRQSELTALFKRLYEDSVLGRIPDEQYRILSAEYIAEQKAIQEELPEAQARLTELKDSEGNAIRFIENARKYTEIPELTSEILHTFIQRVEVGERAERYSRTAPQEIRIYYRDIGIVDDIPETMDISELYEEYPDDVA